MPLADSSDPGAKTGKVRSHRFPRREYGAAVREPRSGAAENRADFLRDGQLRSTYSASR